MSADLLRRAAATLREKANAATLGPQRTYDLAVAEWIEGHCKDLAMAGRIGSCDSPGDVEQAIVVARAILGETR